MTFLRSLYTYHRESGTAITPEAEAEIRPRSQPRSQNEILAEIHAIQVADPDTVMELARIAATHVPFTSTSITLTAQPNPNARILSENPLPIEACDIIQSNGSAA